MMLRILLQTYRQHRGLTLRQMEKQTGVSYVTLHRFEHGKPIIHEELVKIWLWLMNKEKP
jgi:transcriptional regulator with XRE-family HTH domain